MIYLFSMINYIIRYFKDIGAEKPGKYQQQQQQQNALRSPTNSTESARGFRRHSMNIPSGISGTTIGTTGIRRSLGESGIRRSLGESGIRRSLGESGIRRSLGESTSDEDSGRHSTDSNTLASLEDDEITTSIAVSQGAPATKGGNISDEEFTASLREETLEKSSLLSSLTDKMLESTTRYQEQLRIDQVYLQSITKRTNSLNDVKVYKSGKVYQEIGESGKEIGESGKDYQGIISDSGSDLDGLSSCRSGRNELGYDIRAPLLFQNSDGELVA